MGSTVVKDEPRCKTTSFLKKVQYHKNQKHILPDLPLKTRVKFLKLTDVFSFKLQWIFFCEKEKL